MQSLTKSIPNSLIGSLPSGTAANGAILCSNLTQIQPLAVQCVQLSLQGVEFQTRTRGPSRAAAGPRSPAPSRLWMRHSPADDPVPFLPNFRPKVTSIQPRRWRSLGRTATREVGQRPAVVAKRLARGAEKHPESPGALQASERDASGPGKGLNGISLFPRDDARTLRRSTGPGHSEVSVGPIANGP